jgi:hypothetical protein
MVVKALPEVLVAKEFKAILEVPVVKVLRASLAILEVPVVRELLEFKALAALMEAKE